MGVAARRQREKEERRSTILAAAEKVFVTKGVALATMDDIAHEAELSKGTLYLYFDSKDELYLEIAVRALAELLERIEEADKAGGNGAARVERSLRAYVRFATEHADRFRVAVNWMTSDPGASVESERFTEYKRLLAAIYGRATAAIDEGKQDGSVRHELDAGRLFAQLWGASLGVLTLQLSAAQVAKRLPEGVNFENLVTSFVDLSVRALRTDGAHSVDFAELPQQMAAE
jgi:AcrR family transcriptional regulator